MALFGPREIMRSEQLKAKEGNMNADEPVCWCGLTHVDSEDSALGAILRRFILSDEYSDLTGSGLCLDGHVRLDPSEVGPIQGLIDKRRAARDY